MKPLSEVRHDDHSAVGWVFIGIVSAIWEGYLYFFRGHTLSEQMRYWIRYSKLGSVLAVFWGWLAFHFVVEPVVRFVKIRREKWSKDYC